MKFSIFRSYNFCLDVSALDLSYFESVGETPGGNSAFEQRIVQSRSSPDHYITFLIIGASAGQK